MHNPPTRRRNVALQEVRHWQRREWEEIAKLVVHVRRLEEKMGMDPEEIADEKLRWGDPWETQIEYVYPLRIMLALFLSGVVTGILLTGFFVW